MGLRDRVSRPVCWEDASVPRDAWAALADPFVEGTYASVKGQVRAFVLHAQLLRHLPDPRRRSSTSEGAQHTSRCRWPGSATTSLSWIRRQRCSPRPSWVEPAAGAAKAAQVLRPGGLVVIFGHVFEPPAEVAEAFAAAFRRVVPDSPFNREPPRRSLDLYQAM